MKVKESAFNLCFNLDKSGKRQYVFNTRTKKLVKLRNNVQEYLLEKRYLKKLLDCGVLVSEACDEVSEVLLENTNKKYYSRRLMLTIIPTNACNFRCIYCYQPEAECYMESQVIDSLIKWLKRELKYYDELNLSWFGGEPLLAKREIIALMQEIKNMCKQHGVALISSMTTNGYLLDIDTFEILVKNNLLFYQITLDGNKRMHNQLRPHKEKSDSFETITQNLYQIAKLPKKYRFEIGVRINVSNLMSDDDIYEFVDCLAEVCKGDKRFKMIWQWVRNWGGERIGEYNVDKVLGDNTSLDRFIDYASSKGMPVAELISVTTGTDICEAFYKHGYVINYDGGVYKCAMCMNDTEHNRIGVLHTNGYMKIESEKEKLWLKQDSVNDVCAKCKYLPMCLSNRCHYGFRVRNDRKCLEYKPLIESQIKNMIRQGQYIEIEGESMYES